MRSFYPMIFAAIVILITGLIEIIFLRLLTPRWWRLPLIRRLAWSLPLVGMVMVLVWGLAEYHTIKWLALPSAILAVLSLVLEACLMFSLPVSGLFHLVQKLINWHHPSPEKEVDTSRRQLLKSAAVALPIISVGMGATGVGRSFESVRVYRRKMTFTDLPEELDGLRILHLSDTHLRQYVTLDDLSDVLAEAEQYSPDVILVTGDIADDLRMLPEALNMISQMKAPLGSFACLGNHEYFRGITAVRRIFERSQVELLVNQSVRLNVAKSSFFLGGIDDPRVMGSKDHAFYKRTIDITAAELGSDDFSILMSHRPDALDYASEVGINLTLAGHTHGGQIGLGGRSAFEYIWPDRYLWGEYRVKESKLYTSSGVGHWFPFRLGCPAEAPVIELRSA